MAAPLASLAFAPLDLARLDLAPFDAAFAVLLRATAQASVIVLTVLAARLLLRRRLSANARYALWLTLLLPFAAPLLPAIPVSFPNIPQPSLTPAPVAAPRITAPLPGERLRWRVEYEPLAVAPAPTEAEAPEPVNWLRLAGAVWLVGAIALASRVAVTHARAVWSARRAAVLADPELVRLLEQCRRTVRTRRTPLLVAAPPGAGPALLGVLRPRLLLPADSPERLTPNELRFVLLHELVHLKRGDVVAEWLLTLVQIAHWFNPLVWLAAGRCRADREIACDAAVVALAGEAGRADYGRTILKLATELAPRRFAPAAVGAAVGIIEHQSPLERRLRMLAAAPRARGSRWSAALVAIVAAGVVACSNAQTPGERKRGAEAPGGSAGAAAEAPDRAGAGAAKPQAAGRGGQVDHPESGPEIGAARDRVVAEERNDPKNAAVRARLEKVIPEVSFDNAPLGDAVDFFRDAVGANIFVNWNALQRVGVGRDSRVSARFREIKAAKALTIILDSLTPAPRRPLGYSIDDGVVTVSTLEDVRDAHTVTRVYDVRDLLVTIPDFEPPPVEQPVEPKQPPIDPAAREWKKVEDEHGEMRTRQETIDEIIRLVTETVSPDSWRDAGGTAGSVRELQGQFIITQTAENHRQIAALLQQLREARGVQISVETRIIAVDDDVLAGLPAALRDKVKGQLEAAKDPVPAAQADAAARDAKARGEKARGENAAKPDDVRAAGVYLSAEELDQLLRAVQGSAGSGVVTAPRITLFNGQAAYVLVATQRNYVADYTVVKQPNGETKYEPLLGLAHSGIMFWARATASADRKYATLSLQPRFTQLAGLQEVPWHQQPAAPAGGGAEALTVQRPNVLVSELRLTTNIPDGQTLLLGGLRGHFPADGARPEADAPLRNAIMLVKPTLIIQREVAPKEFPLTGGR